MKNLLKSEKNTFTLANIAFEFTKNTGFNRMQYNILLLMCQGN